MIGFQGNSQEHIIISGYVETEQIKLLSFTIPWFPYTNNIILFTSTSEKAGIPFR